MTNTQGEDPKDTSNSGFGLVTTIVPTLAVFLVMILLFIILRRSERRMYMPRTYLGVLRPEERTPPSATGIFNWLRDMYKIPDEYVLQHHSMDAYLMLRFLKLISMICFVGVCLTFPVLLPVNGTGGAGKKQLDILSMSNIAKEGYGRYFAHTFIAWLFVGGYSKRLTAGRGYRV